MDNFFEATALIRKHRSKTAIPLLLKYMVEHASFSTSHVCIPQYVDTLNILIGERIAFIPKNGTDRQKSMDEAILKIYGQWWQSNKKTLSTDIDKMSEERLKFMVSELLRHSNEELAYRHRGSTPQRLVSTEELYQSVTASLRDKRGRHEWWKEELDGHMTPILLNHAGYSAKPLGDPTAGPTRVAYAALPFLAVLRQEGQAPLLDKIASDPKQNNATRLTCILALHFAGEDMSLKTVLSIPVVTSPANWSR